MGAKLKSKTHLQNRFFWFFEPFFRIWLQNLQKVLMWPQKFIFEKNKKKYFESVEKVVIKCTQKKLQAKQVWRTFWVHFSKSAWNSAFFDTQIEFFFALISTFCILWLEMRRKRLKKTENLFLWMCLRILLGNHQRVSITKLLKSLYPTVQCYQQLLKGIFQPFERGLGLGSFKPL